MIEHSLIPRFKQGQSWNETSAKGMNALADAARRASNITGGRGVHVDKRVGGTHISIDAPSVNQHRDVWHVAVVIEPKEEDKILTVRRIGYADLPPSYNELAWTTERIIAYPTYNKRPIDYKAFTFKDLDDNGQPRLPSRDATPLVAQKQTGNIFVIDFPGGLTQTHQQFKIASFAPEGGHLICHTWDGTVEGTDPINVLLADGAPQYEYHGKTEILENQTVRYVTGATILHRTAFIDDLQYQEEQVYTPNLTTPSTGGTIGPSIIYGINIGAVRGGFGQPDGYLEDSQGNNIPILWRDSNQRGRAWAEKFTEEGAQGIVRRALNAAGRLIGL